MFTIDNRLYESSFQYDQMNGTNYLGTREEELFRMQEIWDYCRINEEMLSCNLETFYEIEVEPGVSLCDWVFANQGTGSQDARSMLLYMLDSIKEYENAGDREIGISLGNYEGCAGTVNEYQEKRRELLAEITDVEEFADFMGTCFLNTVFSDNVLSAMRRIPKFRECTKEIVSNLALLNDHAIEIYKRHNCDAGNAMKELSARAIKCTGDSAHKSYLKFPFSYTEKENSGEQRCQIKEVECSPHMKLIRPDSNLRIYFFWFDDDVGDGQKVLIGHIGGHPY